MSYEELCIIKGKRSFFCAALGVKIFGALIFWSFVSASSDAGACHIKLSLPSTDHLKFYQVVMSLATDVDPLKSTQAESDFPDGQELKPLDPLSMATYTDVHETFPYSCSSRQLS